MLFYLKLILFPLGFWFTGGTTPHGNDKPLRVQESLAFDAISDGKKVIVNWTAPNERNYDYFTIERSKDGVSFVSAVMIKGAGKVSTVVDYTDIDYMPFSGISYYRLKQTDYFGETSYSETITVNFLLLKDGSIVPKTEKVAPLTDLSEIENKQILVVLRDIKGNEFVSKVKISSDSGQLYATDTKGALPSGAYTVIATSFNSLFSQKLIIK